MLPGKMGVAQNRFKLVQTAHKNADSAKNPKVNPPKSEGEKPDSQAL